MNKALLFTVTCILSLYSLAYAGNVPCERINKRQISVDNGKYILTIDEQIAIAEIDATTKITCENFQSGQIQLITAEYFGHSNAGTVKIGQRRQLKEIFLLEGNHAISTLFKDVGGTYDKATRQKISTKTKLISLNEKIYFVMYSDSTVNELRLAINEKNEDKITESLNGFSIYQLILQKQDKRTESAYFDYRVDDETCREIISLIF
jgi:hypothetical protein